MIVHRTHPAVVSIILENSILNDINLPEYINQQQEIVPSHTLRTTTPPLACGLFAALHRLPTIEEGTLLVRQKVPTPASAVLLQCYSRHVEKSPHTYVEDPCSLS